MLAGKTVAIEIRQTEPIEVIHREITAVESREGIGREQYWLSFGGKPLSYGGLSMQDYGICTGSTLELMPRLRGGAGSGDLGCRPGESVGDGSLEADLDGSLVEFDLEPNHVFDREDYLKLVDEMQGPVHMAVSLEDLEMPLEDLTLIVELSLEDLECMAGSMAISPVPGGMPVPTKMATMAANEQDLMEGVTCGVPPHAESAGIMSFAAGTTAPAAKRACPVNTSRNQLVENGNFDQLAVVCEDPAWPVCLLKMTERKMRGIQKVGKEP